VIVRFVDTGGIDDHHGLNFHFTIMIKITVEYFWHRSDIRYLII